MKLRLIKTVFLGVGIIMLIISGFVFVNEVKFLAHVSKNQGKVIDLVAVGSNSTSGHRGGGITYAPKIQYQTKSGNTVFFVSSTSSSTPHYFVGEKVNILYDPANPAKAQIDSFFDKWFGPIIALFFGLVFFSVGFGLIIVPKILKTRGNKLKATGDPIDTAFVKVELNEGIEVQGRSPYRVISQWLDPVLNQMYMFHSANIWFDPSDYVKKDQKITVYVDPDNYKKYYMDIGFLPKLK